MSDLPVLKLKRKQRVSKKLKRKQSQQEKMVSDSEPFATQSGSSEDNVDPGTAASVPVSAPVPQKIVFSSSAMQPLFANQYNEVFIECFCVDRKKLTCKVQLGIKRELER